MGNRLNLRTLVSVGVVGLFLSQEHLAGGAQLLTFRAASDAVPLMVAVTTLGGRPVLGLDAGDFEVLDNGQRAEVVAFERQVAPAAVRVLVSQTPRMRKDAARVRELAYALIEQAQPSG